ncbi:MAG: YihY/virulence factor BrkB family protein [Clostridiales bacterium]|nr:YihY/virulence factor BrkB family protein [Clostridiales bacterium]
MGAYAATCAYFLMISFVPFFMIIMAAARSEHADVSGLTASLLAIVPSGLKEYVMTIIHEAQSNSYVIVPLSVLILIWSAAKVFHALSNGLNVISKAKETRGWFFLRVRSMLYVVLFMLFVMAALLLSIFGPGIRSWLIRSAPGFDEVYRFLFRFRSLAGYFGLIIVFLFIYKFLPNCHYTFRSQFPGALIVSTVWMFFSYLMSIYYEHNQNFSSIYGSLTGVVLAMIWLYFCCYFLLFGAELNRVIYEDPEENVIVSTIGVMRDASARRQQAIENELDEHSVWKPIRDGDGETLPSRQPSDIVIPWYDEGHAARAARPPEEQPDFYSRFSEMNQQVSQPDREDRHE